MAHVASTTRRDLRMRATITLPERLVSHSLLRCYTLQGSQHHLSPVVMKLLDQIGRFHERLCHPVSDIRPISIAHRGPEVQVASKSLQQDIGVEELHLALLRLECSLIQVL